MQLPIVFGVAFLVSGSLMAGPIIESRPAVPTGSLRSGVRCRIQINEKKELWLVSSFGAQDAWGYRIGNAGVISEIRDLRDGSRTLLSDPAYPGDTVDRVVQSLFEADYRRASPVPHCNTAMQLNQGGGEAICNGTSGDHVAEAIHPVYDVLYSQRDCRVDVTTVANRMANMALESDIVAWVYQVTSYRIVAEGYLQVRRLVLPNYLRLSGSVRNSAGVAQPPGVQSAFRGFKLATWLPLAIEMDRLSARSGSVVSVGNVAANGAVAFSGAPASGYVTAFRSTQTATAAAVSLVYGTTPPQCVFTHCPDSTFPSAMVWSRAPGVYGNVLAANVRFSPDAEVALNSVIDSTYLIVPLGGFNAINEGLVRSLVPRVPSVKVFGPTMPSRFANQHWMLQRFFDIAGRTPSFAANLGALAYPADFGAELVGPSAVGLVNAGYRRRFGRDANAVEMAQWVNAAPPATLGDLNVYLNRTVP